MCGITGFIDTSHQAADSDYEAIIQAMADSIRHRGPDDYGTWMDRETGVMLGFRRLAILDLSPNGRQPMLSADGRYVIIFNGEVYNFSELRSGLEGKGYSFRGHSDTEVMLNAISEWGVEPAVQRFNGMFALALWDRRERCLHLVRDRAGVKPLYYGWAGKTFLFGSELKALRRHPAFKGEIDRNILALYFRHGYIPAPFSIYRGFYKLLPGTILTLRSEAYSAELVPKPYWEARQMAEAGIQDPFQGTDEQAVGELNELLCDGIKQRMVADVPLGVFLSGGVDSSTITAIMQSQSSIPVKTFTIGFQESAYNEAGYAKAVAQHLHTEHTELYVSPAEAQAVIPRLHTLYDEPYADSSQIPTALVAELARAHVTVSLSGDGGDELFAGYDRYQTSLRRWGIIGRLPGSLRQAGASILNQWASPTLPGKEGHTSLFAAKLRDRLNRLEGMLASGSQEAFYQWMISYWRDPSRLVLGSEEPPAIFRDAQRWPNLPGLLERMMYFDLATYLPDDILVKVDRACMGVSLEGRVPFLDDYRVIELAWRLPNRFKLRGGQGKWLLRQVLYKYVPPSLIERPKKGFIVPMGIWLKGPLREWAEALLDPDRLKREGFLDPNPVQAIWKEHQAGIRDWRHCLWIVLMFQSWFSNQ